MTNTRKRFLNLSLDLQNPLLKKYDFDHVAFTAGATFAIQRTMEAFQSENFKKFSKG